MTVVFGVSCSAAFPLTLQLPASCFHGSPVPQPVLHPLQRGPFYGWAASELGARAVHGLRSQCTESPRPEPFPPGLFQTFNSFIEI